jgi:hypothetical protein
MSAYALVTLFQKELKPGHPIPKRTKAKRAGNTAQVVKCLSNKCEFLTLAGGGLGMNATIIFIVCVM